MLSNIYEFRQHKRKEGLSFRIDENEISFSLIP
jgi:hypothetical protein